MTQVTTLGPCYALIAAVLLLAPAPLAAQPESYRGVWSIAFEGGADGLTGGTVHSAGSGELLGLPVTIERRGFPELFDHGWRIGVGGGYGVTDRMEVIGKLSWGGVNAQNEPVGTIDGFSILALFDDYRDVAFEGGVRYHFSTGVPLEPHVNVMAGFRRVRAISVDLATWSADPAVDTVTFPAVAFFDTSLVPSAGVDFGLSYYVNARIAVGVEVGTRYQGGLRDIDTALAPFGLATINDAGTRWSIPFVAGLRLHF